MQQRARFGSTQNTNAGAAQTKQTASKAGAAPKSGKGGGMKKGAC